MVASFAGVSWEPFIWAMLSLSGAAGLLAVVAPQRFAAVTQYSGQWVHTEKILSALDRRIDVDQYVLSHSRLFGVTVLAGVSALAVLTWRHFV
ncbi:MAG: hypothetical protein GTO62_09850 [Planctomycetales bacterium]|nr:hypothetical protein [Planctomycetales bacterium]NIP69564.1 hypothetical protein [Planctomycetales bacterium]